MAAFAKAFQPTRRLLIGWDGIFCGRIPVQGPWNIGRVHKTLVSNMIIADFSVEARWLSHGLPRWDVKFHTTERNGSEGYHDALQS